MMLMICLKIEKTKGLKTEKWILYFIFPFHNCLSFFRDFLLRIFHVSKTFFFLLMLLAFSLVSVNKNLL